MSSHDTVTESDLRRLLQVVDEAREEPDDRSLPSRVLSGLRELVPCTDVSFCVMDVPLRRTVGGVYLEQGETVHDLSVPTDDATEQDLGEVFWDAWATEYGCGYPQVSGDYTTVLRRSDRMSDRVYARTPMGEFMRVFGVRHQVLVAMPPQGGLERRLLLFRHDGADFTEREVLLLKVFRPHLLELHEWQQRRVRSRPDLTARQWDILRLVARGDSNAQVARALSISQATVRKHLENIFVRLEVCSRTEAAARVAAFLDEPSLPTLRGAAAVRLPAQRSSAARSA